MSVRSTATPVAQLVGLLAVPGQQRDAQFRRTNARGPVRELFDAGLEPALTSDWPYGAEVSDAELPDGFQRTGLAPLAQLAVVVHGIDPRGRTIPGAESRIVDVGRALAPTLALGIDAKAGTLHVANAAVIAGFGQGSEGPIEGAFAGGRIELVRDDRDNAFATRFGGRAVFWSETFGVVGGRAAFTERLGLSASRFVTLFAPDLVLALRAEGATSFGQRSFATDYSLGGTDLLRGYYQNRFRGQPYVAGSGELRVPLIGPLSGTVFSDLGRVWVTHGRDQAGVAASYGAGPLCAPALAPRTLAARLRV